MLSALPSDLPGSSELGDQLSTEPGQVMLLKDRLRWAEQSWGAEEGGEWFRW